MWIQDCNFGMSKCARCSFHEGIYNLPAHIHQYFEVVYVIDGEIEITVDGLTKSLTKGQIAVIYQYQSHGFHTPKYCKLWMCVFSGDLISDFITRDNNVSFPENFYFTPSKSSLSYIDERLLDSNETLMILNEYSERTLKAILYVILEEFLRKVKFTSTPILNDTLSKVLYYMSSNYKNPELSLTSVSKALGYNKNYISHCIESLPNMNFCTLLNSLRIDCAKNLLVMKDYRIIDIALESGFTNERSFHRTFLKITGITPGEYRNKRKSVK